MSQFWKKDELAELKAEVAQLKAKVARQEAEIAQLKGNSIFQFQLGKKTRIAIITILSFMLLVNFLILVFLFVPDNIKWLALLGIAVFYGIGAWLVTMLWKKFNP